MSDLPGSAKSQYDPVAGAAARLQRAEGRRDVAEDKLEKAEDSVAEAELGVAKAIDPAVVAKQEIAVVEAKAKVAEAKVFVAEAELGVAKAKVSVAEAELGVAKARLEKAEERDDPVAIAEAKVLIAEAKVLIVEAKVAVAKQEVAVVEAKVAVAKQSGDRAEQETAKRGLEGANRRLKLAHDAYERALQAGAVPGSVGAAATHPGAEAGPGGGTATHGEAEAVADSLSAFLKAQEQRDERLERGMAAVGDLVRSMRYRAMCPDKQTVRSTESQVAFKNALVARYQAGFSRNGKRFISASTSSLTHIKCAVTGWITSKTQCCAGHLLPHASAHDALAFGLSPDDINDERNGLLLAQGIENVMHPPLRVCFLFDVLHNSWQFAVLDPKLMQQVVSPTRKRFCDFHRKPLEIPDGTSPWRRLLWVHAQYAITSAMKKGWIEGRAWDDELKKLASLLDQVNGKSYSDLALRIWIANST